MPEQRNLILAIVLSVTIILAFQYFYELPRIKEAQRQQPAPSGQVDARPRARATPPSRPARSRPGVAAADARPDARAEPGRRARGSRSATSACTARWR